MSTRKNKNLEEIAELAKAVGLPSKTTKEVYEYIKHDVLLSLYRDPESDTYEDRHAELNQKVCEVYKARYGRKFNPKIHSKNKRLPLFLFGIPGQGKTAVYHAAGRETAAELGLKFIPHVTDDYIPQPNHLIMVVQECAGENSAITFGGLPRVEDGVLKKALNYRFTVFKDTAGGILLFDDAANAPSVIQNVLLPVAQNGTFQGLSIPNACVGFTGNLGSLDGTYVTEASTALLTRVVSMYVTDTLKDFLYRGYAYYNDELGDLGYFNFLERDPNSFASLPEQGKKSGFPCSRSHDNFIQFARSIVERNGGRENLGASLSELHSLANSTLGSEVGERLIAYYTSYVEGADPLAREFVRDGKPNITKLKEKYEGGSSVKALSFGHQFASACADYAIVMLSEGEKVDYKSEKFKEIIERFGFAILHLNNTEFGYGIEHFKSKLAVYVPDYSTPNKDKHELKSDVRSAIAHIINDLENCDQAKRDALISIITDHNKIDAINGLGLKNTGIKGKRQQIVAAP